jgi:hypothetical protein
LQITILRNITVVKEDETGVIKNMGMDIEVIGMTWYTVHLSNEDVEKVKQWLEDHRDNLPSFDPKENISKAVWNLYSKGEISLFDDDKCTESDFNTEEIRWSEFQERILYGNSKVYSRQNTETK